MHQNFQNLLYNPNISSQNTNHTHISIFYSVFLNLFNIYITYTTQTTKQKKSTCPPPPPVVSLKQTCSNPSFSTSILASRCQESWGPTSEAENSGVYLDDQCAFISIGIYYLTWTVKSIGIYIFHEMVQYIYLYMTGSIYLTWIPKDPITIPNVQWGWPFFYLQNWVVLGVN